MTIESKIKGISKNLWKKFWDAVKEADIVLEVLDARDPQSFRILAIEKKLLEMGKKVILVINKSDLIPKEVIEQWKKILSCDLPTVFISARHRLGTRMLRKMIYRNAPKKEEIKVAVIGFPNVGKSTIINILKGSHSAPTGGLPGVTKSLQRVRRGRLIILDTPGVFPIEDLESLVYKGAIRVENLDDPTLYAISLIKKLESIDKDALKRAYNIDYSDPEELLEKIAMKRGKLLKGGKPNIVEAAKILLRDWQNGKIVIWVKPPEESPE